MKEEVWESGRCRITTTAAARGAEHARSGRLPGRERPHDLQPCISARDSTAQLTPADVQALLAYGVGCVIDLRSENETAAAPSVFRGQPGVAYYTVPLLDEAASSGFTGALPKGMGAVYQALLDRNAADFARIVHLLAAHLDKVTLFHCTAGKDRTGVTAMLLLALAGVPREAIVADYAVSEQNMKLVFEQIKRSIREKLLAYLSIQAQAQQSRYFEIPLGRVELAEYLCVDRSALTRELVKMKADGLIDYDKNCFRIL